MSETTQIVARIFLRGSGRLRTATLAFLFDLGLDLTGKSEIRDRQDTLRTIAQRADMLFEAVDGSRVSAKFVTDAASGLVKFHEQLGETVPLMTTKTGRKKAKALLRKSIKLLEDIRKQAHRLVEESNSDESGDLDDTQVIAESSRKVFIGHGRKLDWHILKDFLRDELHLEVQEFNSSSTAGKTTVARLEEMLQSSGFAFLVMTAEDSQTDESLRARENVVHETGLFQGHLGFERAIVLREKGCTVFSNIAGLTILPFDAGKIASTFTEVRKVLVQAGLI